MLIHRGGDSKGPYYQWGKNGAKYRYSSANKESRDNALKKPKGKSRRYTQADTKESKTSPFGGFF